MKFRDILNEGPVNKVTIIFDTEKNIDEFIEHVTDELPIIDYDKSYKSGHWYFNCTIGNEQKLLVDIGKIAKQNRGTIS